MSGRVYSIGIVGESNYQRAISKKLVGTVVDLVHEPDNPFDDRAIRVDNHRGQTIGYLPRGSWLTRAILDEDKSVSAEVGSVGREANSGNYGVTLDVEIESAGRSLADRGDDDFVKRLSCYTYGCAILLSGLLVFGLMALAS